MAHPVRKPEPARRGARRSAAPRIVLFLCAATAVSALAPLVAPPAARAQHYIATADSAHPLVRYADSTVSVNDRCIVRQTGLAYRMRPVYVNGLPIGFC